MWIGIERVRKGLFCELYKVYGRHLHKFVIRHWYSAIERGTRVREGLTNVFIANVKRPWPFLSATLTNEVAGRLAHLLNGSDVISHHNNATFHCLEPETRRTYSLRGLKSS